MISGDPEIQPLHLLQPLSLGLSTGHKIPMLHTKPLTVLHQKANSTKDTKLEVLSPSGRLCG